MIDIVERLREDRLDSMHYQRAEAADEIERLRKALEELLDASKHQPIDVFLRQRCKAALSSTESNTTEIVGDGQS